MKGEKEPAKERVHASAWGRKALGSTGNGGEAGVAAVTEQERER